MENDLIKQLLRLRITVGFLGEKDQSNWWTSAFLAPTSRAFLQPPFPRTRLLAQYSGVTAAARRVHDEHIGVGQVYHLFRLPEDLERALHDAALDSELEPFVVESLGNPGAAQDYLKNNRDPISESLPGPVRVTRDLRDPEAWQLTAGHYLSGFENDYRVFPYFNGNNR